MTIHLLNCFTCNAHWPSKLKTGMACLLIETDQGLVLLATGLGLDDYAHPEVLLTNSHMFPEFFDLHPAIS